MTIAQFAYLSHGLQSAYFRTERAYRQDLVPPETPSHVVCRISCRMPTL